jgi:hypothetical protein
VRLENSPADPACRNPRLNWQFTGNSESTTAFFDLMRETGASAKEMLISAASDRVKAPVSEFRAKQNKVIHTVSGRFIADGEAVDSNPASSCSNHPGEPSAATSYGERSSCRFGERDYPRRRSMFFRNWGVDELLQGLRFWSQWSESNAPSFLGQMTGT